MKKVTIAILITSLFLMSFSASQHFGTTLVNQPSLSEESEMVWFQYWQDQFDGYAGRVIAPLAGKYPEGAVKGYQRALLDWEQKLKKAQLNTYLIYAASVFGVIGILIIAASAAGDDSPSYYSY